MNKRLCLQWPGKDDRHRIEPRLLLPAGAGAYGSHNGDNMLIKGDNLLTLKALEATHAGQVKCIYIDPPYNTGSAFTHYDDGIAHSLWLSLMRDRIEILRNLLRPDGIMFVSIDDEEHAYLKVMMDEIFGRKNFCGNLIWEKKKKPSFLDQNMGSVTENILAYSPNRALSPAFMGGLTTEGKKYPLNNAGNPEATLTFPARTVRFGTGDGTIAAQDMSGGNIKTVLLDDILVEGGVNAHPFRLRGEWRYSQKRLNEIVAAGETLVISKIPFRPNHVKAGGEGKKLKNLLSLAHYGLGTYEDSSAESRALFGDAAFDYPKPESLIELLLNAVTQPGDLVLDSFAGSGTTGAVAHKMGRRWIMVEIGDHADTHIVPRLTKVIEGEDQGGVTKAVGWQGGGGFRYYTLAPSLLERDAYDNWVIAPEYNGPMLAQAMCKHLGFTYDPAQSSDGQERDAEWWRHGRSSERDFLYVTTQALTQDALRLLSEEVGPDRSLLICARAFSGNIDGFENLTCRKIPASILTKCEWGRDDYSLQIAASPERQAVDHTPDAGPLFARAPADG
jgi:adenine-specific DNA-methyltransferase